MLCLTVSTGRDSVDEARANLSSVASNLCRKSNCQRTSPHRRPVKPYVLPNLNKHFILQTKEVRFPFTVTRREFCSTKCIALTYYCFLPVNNTYTSDSRRACFTNDHGLMCSYKYCSKHILWVAIHRCTVFYLLLFIPDHVHCLDWNLSGCRNLEIKYQY